MELQAKFGLLTEEFGAWTATTAPRVECGEWIGIFIEVEDTKPKVICLRSIEFQPCLGLYNIEIPWKPDLFIPNTTSTPYLSVISKETRSQTATWDANGGTLVDRLQGMIRRVRIAIVTRGPKKKKILLYYGRVDHLQWDPERFHWNWIGGTPFMNYTTKMGRLMLRRNHVVPHLVTNKWRGILP